MQHSGDLFIKNLGVEMKKLIGGIFILTGSAIGAGMLALPLVGAASGFTYSTIILILNWLLMTLTALLTLETSTSFKPYNNSFSTMTKKLLGTTGQTITWIAYLLLLYTTAAAYISGGTSLLDTVLKKALTFEISFGIEVAIFTLLFAIIVFWGTHIVDYSIRFLLSIKIFFLIVMLTILAPYVDGNNLLAQPFHTKYLWAATPIFLNAFGFHCVIPSVVSYCNQPAKVMRWVIITATTIPLLVYIMWLFISLGLIPINGNLSYINIIHEGTSVGGLIQALVTTAQSKLISVCTNLFFNIAMTTSFLGVALGLFDFLADGLKRKNSYPGRLQTTGLTFLPPFLFVLLYKNGFVLALEYSAIFAVILEIFLPAILVYKLRKNNLGLSTSYKVPINAKFLLISLSGIGLFLLTIIIADKFNLLPTLS